MRAPTLPALAAAVGSMVLGSALTACGPADDAVETVVDVADGCPRVQVVGLRGQAQSLERHRGLGTEVDAVVTMLESSLADAGVDDVEVDAVRHRSRDAASLDVYDADVAEGSTMLVDRLAEVSRDCPDAVVVVVGFSQGAQIAQETLAAHPGRAADVDALALLGSPRHDPGPAVEHVDLAGPTPTLAGSLGAGPDLGGLGGRTVDACLDGDVVCAFDGGDDHTIHKRGYEDAKVSRAVADALVALLR